MTRWQVRAWVRSLISDAEHEAVYAGDPAWAAQEAVRAALGKLDGDPIEIQVRCLSKPRKNGKDASQGKACRLQDLLGGTR